MSCTTSDNVDKIGHHSKGDIAAEIKRVHTIRTLKLQRQRAYEATTFCVVYFKFKLS